MAASNIGIQVVMEFAPANYDSLRVVSCPQRVGRGRSEGPIMGPAQRRQSTLLGAYRFAGCPNNRRASPARGAPLGRGATTTPGRLPTVKQALSRVASELVEVCDMPKCIPVAHASSWYARLNRTLRGTRKTYVGLLTATTLGKLAGRAAARLTQEACPRRPDPGSLTRAVGPTAFARLRPALWGAVSRRSLRASREVAGPARPISAPCL